MDGSTGGSMKGCPECDYRGYVYYKTGVVDGVVEEVLTEPCGCYFEKGEDSRENI